MNSIFFAFVALCLLAAIIMLVFKPYDYGASMKRFQKIASPDDNPDTSADTKWRSVKIRPGLISCKSVTKMSDQVFLSKDAPSLPLENCREKDCRCHYVFLDDRRSGAERRAELGRLGEYFPAYDAERRLVPGRRMADLAI